MASGFPAGFPNFLHAQPVQTGAGIHTYLQIYRHPCIDIDVYIDTYTVTDVPLEIDVSTDTYKERYTYIQTETHRSIGRYG